MEGYAATSWINANACPTLRAQPTISASSSSARSLREPAITSHTSQAVPDPIRACRSCGAPLELLFVDLGMSPPCEDFLTADRLQRAETFYPLDVHVCERCLLVQLPMYIPPERIFADYAYFSSYSDSWLRHASDLVDEAIERGSLDESSLVVEVASNDGYLLQHVRERGIRALGIEPAANVAAVARSKGIETVVEFFSADLATRIVREVRAADLVVANNVFAHVPDLNDFTAGLAILLRRGGLLSIEVQYLARLIERAEFDTIYHEHFTYYTVLSAEAVLARHGLRLLDVQEVETHGGSIRLWAVHDDDDRPSRPSVETIKAREQAAGLDSPRGYAGFAEKVNRIKQDVLEFLIAERRKGMTIAGYGAPGKANTLLNYCGIGTDLVDFLVDRNPYKHGRFTPGRHIPIYAPEQLALAKPDVIVVMPWNLRDEIRRQLRYTRTWGARLVVAIPFLEILG